MRSILSRISHRIVTVVALVSAVLALGTNVSMAQGAGRVMIILDGSGSMWGQIEGEPKISIARKVLKDVLGATDGELELGLMAYGHREKGQCGDIEIIMQPASGNGPAIGNAADDISPLGKTPLSASVKIAAEALKYTEEKATIILITDGIETCNTNICEMGASLESLGVDFTAHVVGFGLSAEEGQQVACLAQETGGLYVQADDAEALNMALAETVEEIVEVAVIEEEIAVQEAAEESEPVEVPEASIDGPESVEIGKPFATIWDGPGGKRDYIYLVDPLVENKNREVVASRRVMNGDMEAQSVTLIAPVHPGTYELRYVWSNKRITLASRTIEVLDAAVSLDAPATVAIARPFTTIWQGPGGRRDTIEIIDPRGAPGDGKRLRGLRLANGDFENNKVTMGAPAEPGFYRLQYWSGDGGEVLATREIEVLDAETSLAAPAEVDIGKSFDVVWVGPGDNADFVRLHDSEGTIVVDSRISNGDFRNRTVTLLAPAIPGEYELRYHNRDNRADLASRPITIADAEVALNAPDSAKGGELVTIEWIGPGAPRDRVQLFDPRAKGGKGGEYHSQRVANANFDAQTVEFRMPIEAGEYELRYFSIDSGVVLASRTITVEAVESWLEAADSVPMGLPFEVKWAGPGSPRDEVRLYDPIQKSYYFHLRLTKGDTDAQTVDLRAPVVPGDYELHYYNIDNAVILATLAISIVAVDVSLDGPSNVTVGAEFEVSWIGPGAERDEIRVNNASGKTVAKRRLLQGDMRAKTVVLPAPTEPGDYVLIYWNADNKVALYETLMAVQ